MQEGILQDEKYSEGSFREKKFRKTVFDEEKFSKTRQNERGGRRRSSLRRAPRVDVLTKYCKKVFRRQLSREEISQDEKKRAKGATA